MLLLRIRRDRESSLALKVFGIWAGDRMGMRSRRIVKTRRHAVAGLAEVVGPSWMAVLFPITAGLVVVLVGEGVEIGLGL